MQTNKDNSLALSSDTVRDNKLQVQVRCDWNKTAAASISTVKILEVQLHKESF